MANKNGSKPDGVGELAASVPPEELAKIQAAHQASVAPKAVFGRTHLTATIEWPDESYDKKLKFRTIATPSNFNGRTQTYDVGGGTGDIARLKAMLYAVNPPDLETVEFLTINGVIQHSVQLYNDPGNPEWDRPVAALGVVGTEAWPDKANLTFKLTHNGKELSFSAPKPAVNGWYWLEKVADRIDLGHIINQDRRINRHDAFATLGKGFQVICISRSFWNTDPNDGHKFFDKSLGELAMKLSIRYTKDMVAQRAERAADMAAAMAALKRGRGNRANPDQAPTNTVDPDTGEITLTNAQGQMPTIAVNGVDTPLNQVTVGFYTIINANGKPSSQPCGLINPNDPQIFQWLERISGQGQSLKSQ